MFLTLAQSVDAPAAIDFAFWRPKSGPTAGSPEPSSRQPRMYDLLALCTRPLRRSKGKGSAALAKHSARKLNRIREIEAGASSVSFLIHRHGLTERGVPTERG